MSVEQELKGFIVARYGTVKDFAISIDMPPSTLEGEHIQCYKDMSRIKYKLRCFSLWPHRALR